VSCVCRRLLALVTDGTRTCSPRASSNGGTARAAEHSEPATRLASLAAAPGAGEQAPAIAEASALRGALAGEAATGACVPRHRPLSACTAGKLVVAPRGNGLAWVQLSAPHSARLRPSLPCSTSRAAPPLYAVEPQNRGAARNGAGQRQTERPALAQVTACQQRR